MTGTRSPRAEVARAVHGRLGAPVFVPDVVAGLRADVDAGILGAAEVHLAAWAVRTSGHDDLHVARAVALAAWAARHGHSCADLRELPAVVARELAHLRAEVDGGPAVDLDTRASRATAAWPPVDEWLAALRTAPPSLVRHVDRDDDPVVLGDAPLVVCGTRVALQRHWFDECTVAASVRSLVAGTGSADQTIGPLGTAAAELLDRLLPSEVDGEPNLQRRAADVAVANRLSVIVGGPGTGKTYSVARLLAVLATDLLDRGRPARIALAAPTGKAAARLHESVHAALDQPAVQAVVDPTVRALLADLVPTTIHRLLGPLADRRHRFRHHAGAPLPHDVVVIDETSMVSAPLLARTLEAVRPGARVVLLGDPDQLESVELGAVLGDLVAAGGPDASSAPLVGRVVRLVRGHRFGGGSPIALLADAVRRGDADGALAVLRAGDDALTWIETDDPTAAGATAAVEAVVAPVLRAVRTAAEREDAEGALAASARLRILCAHRLGPYGVAAWNELGRRWSRPDGTASDHSDWAPGRPLLVTRNDARLRLANGDTGVVVREGERAVAVFAAAGGLLRYDPVQLADVETAYAMTVHKSQGSEYATVVMVLPPATSPLAGRELLYTGVTRARDRLVVVGDEVSVRRSIATPAQRMTGLAAALAH